MSENPIEMFWKNTYKRILTESNFLSRIISHPGIIGHGRETILGNFIEKFIPSQYKISFNKKIFDTFGNESNEQDILIWNPQNTPRIFKDLFEVMNQIYLNYIVVGCIEVKSILNRKELFDSFKNIKNLRNLKQYNLLDEYIHHRPFNIIFAYDTNWISIKTIMNNIIKVVNENNINPMERFDVIYILNKGLFFTWSQFKDPESMIETKIPRFSALTVFPSHLNSEYDFDKLVLVCSRTTNEFFIDFSHFGKEKELEINENYKIHNFMYFIYILNLLLQNKKSFPITELIYLCYPYFFKSDSFTQNEYSEPI